MDPSSHDPIEIALAEDIGGGDLTSEFFIPETRRGTARIFAKEPCVVAGVSVVRAVYLRLDPQLELVELKQDGSRAVRGDTVIELSGSLRNILTGERVALNFLQRLSGVATLTAKFVEAVRGTGAVILDTRKTTPGLRTLEKAAVKAGGGQNHRMGLYDGVMIKDNHLLAKPDLQNAIDSIRKSHSGILIEVEADTFDQVREFVQLKGIDVILLDNMSAGELHASVALKKTGIKFEASGGVSLGTVRQIAETGVDFVSVGQLTHSARAIDFSLELLDA
jgi:nicotinate-nucleotide pyrophosphorylase (carboxylating)